MTVAEMIEHLKQFPQDATVLRRGDEFNGDTRGISLINYHAFATLGRKGNTVLIE